MSTHLDGQIIRDFLEKKGRRVEWLASELEVSMSTVRAMLNGYLPVRSRPFLLRKLGTLTGLRQDQLLTDRLPKAVA